MIYYFHVFFHKCCIYNVFVFFFDYSIENLEFFRKSQIPYKNQLKIMFFFMFKFVFIDFFEKITYKKTKKKPYQNDKNMPANCDYTKSQKKLI